MKTTKQRLLNIVITMSVIVNFALLAGVGYIASVDHRVNRACSAMNSPVIVYVGKSVEFPGGVIVNKSPAKP